MIMNDHRYYIERQRIQMRRNSFYFNLCIIASHLCGQGQIPASTPYVGRVYCWFSPLHRKVFLRVLRFSRLLKNQHFQIPIRSGKVDEEPLCGCASSKSLFIYLYIRVYPALYRQQRPLLPRMNIRENSSAAFLVVLFLGTQKEYFLTLQRVGHDRPENPNFHISHMVQPRGK